MKLRPWQAEAVDAALASWDDESVVIQAVMGAGKSIVQATLAWQADDHVVVTVPTQVLATQMRDTIQSLEPRQTVGCWYADESDLWPVTVVCQMSLDSYEAAWREKYAHLSPARTWIADECHRTECDTVLDWLDDARIDRRVGFTATPWRAEESESISAFTKLAYQYTAQDAWRDGYVVRPQVQHPLGGDPDDVVIEWMKEHARSGRKSIVANAADIADCEAFALELQRRRIPNITVHSKSASGYGDARKWIAEGLGVVCYVDMLSEGFDAPGIQAMALRRPVGSRVRFAQEVGRGLRAAPDKDCCYMLDVYDLFSTHSIGWREALGEVQIDIVPALKLVHAVEASSWSSGGAGKERLPHELLSPIRSWLRTTRVQLQFEGKVSLRLESTHWRSDPVTGKQVSMCAELMRRMDVSSLDPETRRCLETAYFAAQSSYGCDPSQLKDQVRKGDVSDLILILRGLS